MELTFIQQSTAFFYSIFLGIFLGVFYGGIKFLRTAVGFGRAVLILLDVLFMLVVTLSIFFLSISYLLGFIRVYMFFGTAVGFFAYRLTLGRLFSKVYCPIIAFFKKLSRNIYLKFKKIAKKLLKITYNILYNIIKKIRIFRNKLSYRTTDKRVVDSNEETKAS